MDTTPTLSIITINLNNHDGLKRTIDSVVCQTFTDYEWIVIDGGSTDGSRELIEQYQNHFAYWVSEPDKGIYNAMNKGIAHAHGEWLQFLNSGDCLYQNTTLEKVFSRDYEADIIYGNGAYCENRTIFTLPSQLSLSCLLKHNISHQASFYKRSLYDNKLFDEQFLVVADYALILEFAISGKKFEYINQILVLIEGGGISSTNIGDAETLIMKKKVIPIIVQKDIDKLNTIEEQLFFINSHKTLKLINNLNLHIISLLGKAIRIIEGQRKKSHNS